LRRSDSFRGRKLKDPGKPFASGCIFIGIDPIRIGPLGEIRRKFVDELLLGPTMETRKVLGRPGFGSDRQNLFPQ
jgi:hypothetical protein